VPVFNYLKPTICLSCYSVDGVIDDLGVGDVVAVVGVVTAKFGDVVVHLLVA